MIQRIKDFVRERKIGDHTVTLPEPPRELKLIANYDLPQAKQKFYRTELPKDFSSWSKEARKEFINREWDRRLNGYWFYNNGNIEYITGLNYFYINWWRINTGYPMFIDCDRDFFYVWKMCEDDPKCDGLVYITGRGTGKTFKSTVILYDPVSRRESVQAGIQSKTEQDARKIFNKLVFSWSKLPYFFRPIDVGVSRPAKIIEFSEPSSRNTKSQDKADSDVLDSFIDYQSSGVAAYDGQNLHRAFADEFGKCLSKGTKVLFYNGEVKSVEDIIKGDILMGDDSHPRVVSSISRGVENMYEVVPNKGISWGCNESHILSLKVSSSGIISKYKKGDTLNISVKDFLGLPSNVKRHLMLYRVGVEYKESEHIIDPYLLGLWLGDGSSRDTGITAIENEIISYLSNWCSSNGLFLRSAAKSGPNKTKTHYITTKKIGAARKNKFLNLLRDSDLICNKHIPNNYLIDSSENRLLLLAGLLDTDGFLTKKGINGDSQNFEITQKNKILAYDIHKLCNSLGFYASITQKTASMKRADGTYYYCEVYRINIFGDLYKIPCLIERKKAIKVVCPHKNTRNPLRTGFKLIDKGVGDYYGFSIDKNKLFVLGDYTVTHNTTEVDVDERMATVRECLRAGRGKYGRGKIIATTTVEEMLKKGGANAKRIWNKANINERDDNGFTKNGLYRLFKPSDYGYLEIMNGESFVDDYGYSDREKTLNYFLNKRKALKGADLNSEKRKFPLEEKDIWVSDSKKSVYDTDKIEQQLSHNDTLPDNILVRGNFVWKDGIKDTFVVWHPCDNGKWNVYWMPKPEDRNKQIIKYGLKCPANKEIGCFGLDPYDNDTTVDDRKSDAASYGFRRFDPMVPYDSGIFVCEYVGRPHMAEIMWEDMIMQAVFYGWEILIETNKIGTVNHFNRRGYRKYLMMRPEETQTATSAKMEEPGIPMSGREARQALIYATESYIINKVGMIEEEGVAPYMGKCYFKKLLDNWKDFDFDEEWTKFDSMVGAGLALLGGRQHVVKQKKQETIMLFEKYDNSGMQSKLIGTNQNPHLRNKRQ